ncbi:MAG: protein disulfide isomerase family protein [Patescibacteria group bacterium]
MKNILLIVGIVVILGGAMWYFSRPRSAYGNLDSFAQCLAEHDITMYGAEWCSHCQNEKAQFGKSFTYVPYVECPDNPKLCLEKGVEGYPTWLLPDGTKLKGEQGIENLSKASGCALQ